MLKFLSFAAAIAITANSAKADEFYAVTPSGAAETIFSGSAKSTVAKIASKCIDTKWTVITSSDSEVVCEAPMNFGQSLVGTLLMGNSYSTPPRRFFRFNIAELNGVARVQGSGWMELQMAFGQMRRTDFSGAEFQNNITGFMMSSGGQLPVGTTFPNHARLGVEGTFLTGGQAQGYKVTSIDPTGPAGPAGLLEGDLIEKVAGKSAKDDNSLTDGLAKAAKKPTYTVDVIRSGKPVTVTFLRVFHPSVTSQVEAAVVEASNAVGPQGSQPSVADELEKLAKLRDQHILTSEEFEQRKLKLLAQ